MQADGATYFNVVAGVQTAPQPTDTLAKLGAITAAAAVDDVAAVVSAAGRYRADLRQLNAVPERIAQGDLSADSDWHIHDGFGRMPDAIRSMRDRLRGLVTQMQVASGEIHGAADEIALGNQDLSVRSEHAAARVREPSSCSGCPRRGTARRRHRGAGAGRGRRWSPAAARHLHRRQAPGAAERRAGR